MAVEKVLPSISTTVTEAFAYATVDIQEKLKPTIGAINHVYAGVVQTLTDEHLSEEDIVKFLHGHRYPTLTEGQKISVYGRDLESLAHQYEHVRKIMGATLEVKRTLLELNAPDRTVAYQTGTGWPLPLENDHCTKIGFIHYGDGPLAEFSPRGTRSDRQAGMHIYQIDGENGKTITLLALKGRMHAYTETGWETASHDLAFMPRLLKGIGTEFVLSTFASGVDSSLSNDGVVHKHDLAVVVGGTDDSRLSTTMGPGTGDQRILGRIFGGPFMNIAAMQPEANHVSILLDVLASDPHSPQIFPTLETDTSRTPNFQDAWAHAAPHTTFNEVVQQGKLPRSLMDLFPNTPLALVHGMVQYIEREANFQSSLYAVESPWNRRLPELPLVIFTDIVDPGEHGQSNEISDEAVRAAGKEAEEMTASIITRFFQQYCNQ